jgi:hypothetical protein
VSDPYRKFSAGDPPPHTVAREDKISEVLSWYARTKDKIGAAGGGLAADAGLINVRNDTNQAVGQFAILGIDGVVFTPAANLQGFKNGPIFKGATPTIAAHDGNFCVTAAPIAANSIGKARVVGLTPVQISVTNATAWYEYADVTNSNTAILTLVPAGQAKVMYKESENSGTTWALVALGTHPGNISARVKLDEALTSGSGNGAAASVWDGDPLADTGNNLTAFDGDSNWSLGGSSSASFSANATAIVTWYPASRKWQLENASCNTS